MALDLLPFHDESDSDFGRLVSDPGNLASNLDSYIEGFSPNVRDVLDRFEFDAQIERMSRQVELPLAMIIRRLASEQCGPSSILHHGYFEVAIECLGVSLEHADRDVVRTLDRGDAGL